MIFQRMECYLGGKHMEGSCPFCQDTPVAFQLKHGGKSCWFDFPGSYQGIIHIDEIGKCSEKQNGE